MLNSVRFVIRISCVLTLFLVGCKDRELEFADRSSQFDDPLPTTSLWDFSDPSQYTFNSNFIEVSGGSAQLKTVDQSLSGVDFIPGRHVGTKLDPVSNRLTISDRNDSSLSIRDVIPEKNSSLVAYWPFENNANDLSLSSTTHNLTVTGSPSFSTTSQIGEYSVDYTLAGYHRASDHPEFDTDLSNGFAISLWYYHTSTGATERLIGRMCFDGASWVDTSWGISKINTGALQFTVTSDGSTFQGVTMPFSLQENDWYHVVAVYDGNIIKLYIDGILAVSNSIGAISIHDSNLDLTVGRRHNGPGCTGSSQPVQGLLDDIAVWKTSLNDDEVRQIYNGQSQRYTELSSLWTPKWNNLVGYWKMDGNWLDSSGNENHGSPQNSATHTGDSKVGSQALRVTRSVATIGDYIDVGSDSSLHLSTSVSMMAWVKPTGFFEDGTIIRNGSGTDLQYGMFVPNNQKLRFHWYDGSFQNVESDAMLNLDSWQHIAIVRTSDNNVRLYIDGVLDFSTLVTQETGGGGLVHIGATNGTTGGDFNGEIDEVAIFNSELSSSDIAFIYNRQKQKYAGHYDSPIIDLGTSGDWTNLDAVTPLPFGKEIVAQGAESSSNYKDLSSNLGTGLAGYWTFSEETWADVADEVIDLSGNDNHGRARNGAVTAEGGLFERAAHLDGDDQFILVDDDDSLDFGTSTDFTLSFWVKGVKTGFRQYVINRNWIFALSIGSTGAIEFFFNSGGFCTLRNTGDVLDGEWHLVTVAVERNSACTLNEMQLYIDGVLDPTNYLSNTAINTDVDVSTTGWLRLGSSSASDSAIDGYLDEVAIWARELTASEVQQLYRRGANRIKYQVKSCMDELCQCASFNTTPQGSANDCDGDGTPNATDLDDAFKAEFVGPGGNGMTTYSELYNRSSGDMTFNCSANTTDSDASVCVDDEITLVGDSLTTTPSFSFSDFPASAQPPNNRYFQYRVMMEAEDNTACGGEPCLPELTSIEIGPTGRYYGGSPVISSNTSIPYNEISSLSLSESGSCDLSYQLSPDGSTYYYFDGSSWVSTSGDQVAQSTLGPVIVNEIQGFSALFGPGNLYFKAFLGSDTTESCSIDQIEVQSLE